MNVGELEPAPIAFPEWEADSPLIVVGRAGRSNLPHPGKFEFPASSVATQIIARGPVARYFG
jgi:hypothetical protein